MLLGPWGSAKYGYGIEPQIVPVISGTNGPEIKSDTVTTLVTKKEEASRRQLAKQ
jgi:hypothetical protein